MALSNLDTKILKAAALKADGNRLSVEEIAVNVGCTPDTIHKRLQSDEFRGLFIETVKNSLVSEIPKVLNAFVSKAVSGSFQHGKLVLEIAGAYTETKNIKADLGIKEGESPFKNDEERRAFLSETLGKLNLEVGDPNGAS